ncbi:hypothetical protein KP509_01G079300 [Ceratopteris richardii]|nr:hypothetical protein KP509_01G079300 [Ceratopteris richardii]
MKMKMLQMKSEFRQKAVPDENKHAVCCVPSQVTNNDTLTSRLDHERMHTSRDVPVDQPCEHTNLKSKTHGLKHDKDASFYKTRKRVNNDAQKKASFEDVGKIVSCLQRLLNKKEKEIQSVKHRQKELKSRLYDLRATLQRGRVTQTESKKLLSLLLALSDWLRSMKVDAPTEDREGNLKPNQVHELEQLLRNLGDPNNQFVNDKSHGDHIKERPPCIENLETIVNKEIKMLQHILAKLTLLNKDMN